MNSAIAVAIGLTLAIILILKKCHPVYALILGAVVSGLMSGWGFAKSYDRNAWVVIAEIRKKSAKITSKC